MEIFPQHTWSIIADLKKEGIQNAEQLIKDVEEYWLDNSDMIHTLIKDYVREYETDDFMSMLSVLNKTIKDYKEED